MNMSPFTEPEARAISPACKILSMILSPNLPERMELPTSCHHLLESDGLAHSIGEPCETNRTGSAVMLSDVEIRKCQVLSR